MYGSYDILYKSRRTKPGQLVGKSIGPMIEMVASSNPGRCGGRIFFAGVNFMC